MAKGIVLSQENLRALNFGVEVAKDSFGKEKKFHKSIVFPPTKKEPKYRVGVRFLLTEYEVRYIIEFMLDPVSGEPDGSVIITYIQQKGAAETSFLHSIHCDQGKFFNNSGTCHQDK